MTETSNFIWGQHVNYIPEFLLISKDLCWKGWVIQQSCPRSGGRTLTASRGRWTGNRWMPPPSPCGLAAGGPGWLQQHPALLKSGTLVGLFVSILGLKSVWPIYTLFKRIKARRRQYYRQRLVGWGEIQFEGTLFWFSQSVSKVLEIGFQLKK